VRAPGESEWSVTVSVGIEMFVLIEVGPKSQIASAGAINRVFGFVTVVSLIVDADAPVATDFNRG
jgi:hypothetical protein